MRARLAMTGAVLVALGLTACSGGGAGQQADSGSRQQAAPATSSGVASSAVVDEATYIKALRNLDAGLVTDEKAALGHGYALCQGAADGLSTSDQVGGAIELFEVDAKKGQRIVAIATTNLCQTPS